MSPLANGERRPLIVFLHGLGGSGKLMFDALGLGELGRVARVNVLAPDGTPDSSGRRFWNAGAACCNFEQKPVDDVARLGSLFRSWSAAPGIDAKALYVVGYSNGGFMAHRLACVLGDLLAGAVSLAGAVGEDMPACTGQAALDVLEIHGDRDSVVRYAGGTVFDSPGIGRHHSARSGLMAWGRWLGCPGSPEPGASLDLDPGIPGPETETLAFRSCARGGAALWTVRGAAHGIEARSQLLAQIWDYLASRRKP